MVAQFGMVKVQHGVSHCFLKCNYIYTYHACVSVSSEIFKERGSPICIVHFLASTYSWNCWMHPYLPDYFYLALIASTTVIWCCSFALFLLGREATFPSLGRCKVDSRDMFQTQEVQGGRALGSWRSYRMEGPSPKVISPSVPLGLGEIQHWHLENLESSAWFCSYFTNRVDRANIKLRKADHLGIHSVGQISEVKPCHWSSLGCALTDWCLMNLI
jgi:hypothetical protein